MIDQKKYENAFRYFEIWWANIRMYMKMNLHFIALLAVAKCIIFASLTWIFMRICPLQGQLAYGYIYGNLSQFFYSNPTFSLSLPSGTKFVRASEIVNSSHAASAAGWSILLMIIFFLMSCSVYLLLPHIIKYFEKKGEAYFADEHIRGVKILTEDLLALAIKATNMICYLMVGNVPWPFDFETEHLIIYAKTRAGKTVLIFQMLLGLRAKNAKVLLLDVKLDYIAKWYRPELGDKIYNILDARSVSLNLFREVKTQMDVEGVAYAIIPDVKSGNGNEVFFCDAARAILIGGMHACIANNTKTMAALRTVITSDTKLIHDTIEKTKAGRRGAQFIQQDTSSLAGSVMAVVMQYCGWMDYISDEPGDDFSLVDWVNDGKGGFLYVASNDDCEKVLRPAISLAFDLIAKKISAMPDCRERRIYLVMDEFSSLQRLSSIVSFFTKAGSKGGSGIITTQDIHQIEDTYGKNHSRTLNNSFGTVVALKTKDPDTSEYLSKSFGRREYNEWQVTHTMRTSDDGDGSSVTKQKRDEAAISATEIQTLKKLEYYIQMPDQEPAKGKLKIMDVNNLPQINEPFIPRKGLRLDEIYSLEREIERITEELGFGPKSREKDLEKENDLEEEFEEKVEMNDKKQLVDVPEKNVSRETAQQIERIF